MAVSEEAKRLRQVRNRITIKREDMGRLRDELAALQTERKELMKKLNIKAGAGDSSKS